MFLFNYEKKLAKMAKLSFNMNYAGYYVSIHYSLLINNCQNQLPIKITSGLLLSPVIFLEKAYCYFRGKAQRQVINKGAGYKFKHLFITK